MAGFYKGGNSFLLLHAENVNLQLQSHIAESETYPSLENTLLFVKVTSYLVHF